MPIYEYQCQNCLAEFELIRSFKDADNEVACDQCHGSNIKRKLSLFNASSGGKSITSSNCGTCSGGNCGSCGGH